MSPSQVNMLTLQQNLEQLESILSNVAEVEGAYYIKLIKANVTSELAHDMVMAFHIALLKQMGWPAE